MLPSEFERICQEESGNLLETMKKLTKSNDPVIAFRATEFLLKRAYGDIGKTGRDPWDAEKKQGKVGELLDKMLGGGKDNEE